MKCKFCQGDKTFKHGIVRGHQRYKCKGCGKNFTDTPFRGVGEQNRLLALGLYASGLSMNRIAQFFGVSCVAVMKWIRKLSDTLCPKPEPSPEDRVLVMEVDEFWHYLKKRNTRCGSLKPMIVIEADLLTGSVATIVLKPLSGSMIV